VLWNSPRSVASYCTLSPYTLVFYFLLIVNTNSTYCEWKGQAGNVCVASFDWSCSGICKSVERIKDVHARCGEGDSAVWTALI
jgi:hypothetical protein